jgi:outer membrane protein OmpA-like peptidoglycan-associated protein
MSRFREPPGGRRRGGVVVGLAVLVALWDGSAASARSVPAPPLDAIGLVEEIVGEVESLDGTESETRAGETVTLALTSDVLFAFDKAVLTAQARDRLRKAADRIKAEGAGGPIRIEGHTDDQGSDSYNDGLSQRRAESVRAALAAMLSGQNMTLQARGFGEHRPKVPNIVDGNPNERNRAKNRRVEIIFTVKQ